MIGLVKMRQLDVDENFSLRGHTLERAIEVRPKAFTLIVNSSRLGKYRIVYLYSLYLVRKEMQSLNMQFCLIKYINCLNDCFSVICPLLQYLVAEFRCEGRALFWE